MTCKPCAAAANKPVSAVYDLTCVDCCARLVLSARPSKPNASAMLAAIARFKGAPTRAEVLEKIKAR